MAQDYTPAVQGAYGEGNGLMVAVLALGTCLADDFPKQGFTINGRFWRYVLLLRSVTYALRHQTAS